jgi:hypothetical protein
MKPLTLSSIISQLPPISVTMAGLAASPSMRDPLVLTYDLATKKVSLTSTIEPLLAPMTAR